MSGASGTPLSLKLLLSLGVVVQSDDKVSLPSPPKDLALRRFWRFTRACTAEFIQYENRATGLAALALNEVDPEQAASQTITRPAAKGREGSREVHTPSTGCIKYNTQFCCLEVAGIFYGCDNIGIVCFGPKEGIHASATDLAGTESDHIEKAI